MRVGMQAWGSDGDIRPVLALGGGLARRGHAVTVAVASVDLKDYGPLCKALGIELVTVHVEQRIEVKDMLAASGENPSELSMAKMLLRDFLFPALTPLGEAAQTLVATSDLLVGHMMAWPLHAAALRAQKPYASVSYWPGLIPDPRRPPRGLPSLGTLGNRFSWSLVQTAVDWAVGPRLRQLWDEHGLARRSAIPDTMYSATLNLIASSPALYPGLGDWAQHRFCGQFQMPTDAEPALPPTVEAYLAAGEPPAFLGLGSSTQIDPDVSEAFLVGVAEKLDRRCLVQLAPRRAIPAVVSHKIHFVHQVAHGPLFPRCAAVMHHGGAGTTHSVLAAGKPAVVVAFMGEQTAWGEQLVKAGAGGGVFRYRKVTPDRVADALRATLDSVEMQVAARRLAAEMQNDGGVATGVRHLEALVHAPGRT